jgi:DNA modification methylase
MNTELVSISDLTPDPANARKHGERNLSSIIDSLRAFGQQKPIVVDRRGVVVAGNGTLEAAKRLGWEEIAVVRTELDPTQATAFGIADNRTAELAEWDEDVLVSLLDSLDDETRDLLHFDEKELEAMVPKATVEVVEDEVPEEVEPRTKPGDLWLLGRHRLLCGDSTKAEDVSRLMDGKRADLMATDPPYGIGYKYKNHIDTEGDEYLEFCDEWFREGLRVSSRQVITTGWKYPEFWLSKNPSGQLVWFDDTKQSGHSVAHMRKTEPIFFFGKPLEKYKWDIFQDRGVRGDGLRELHSCPKPLSLFANLIEPQCSISGLVFDPFLGSGTTLIACEQLKRSCFGMEIDPTYCDVIVKRWENLTGETAVLET